VVAVGRRAVVSVTAAVAVLVVVTGTLLVRRQESHPAAGTLPIGQPVSVQRATGLVFVPAADPAQGAGYLDAAQAWAKWEDGRTFPALGPPQFGAVTEMTAPAGTPGNQVSYSNKAVWAFRQIGCIASNGLATAPTDVPSDRFGPCITWVFLDGHTGQGVLITQQQAAN
jgi:hypothetical protein